MSRILPRHRILMLEGEVKMLTEVSDALRSEVERLNKRCKTLENTARINLAAYKRAKSAKPEVADGWMADGSWKP